MTHDILGEGRHLGPEFDALTPAQASVYNEIAAGPRGTVVGPLRVWLTSPELAEKAQALGQFARYDSSLPPHLSELAILVTARIWNSGFEWTQHAPIALAAGVPENVVTAIGLAECPDLPDNKMAAVFDFAVELHRDKQVSDGVYGRAIDVLGEVGCVDLTAICGYYTLISMTINAFEVPQGEGMPLPLIDLPADRYFRR